MIFEQETIGFQILDVLSFDQEYIKRYNHKRNFDALSFRFEADTLIEFKNTQLHFRNNSIGFFPSNVDYTRISQRDKMIVIHFTAYNYHSSEIESFFPEDSEKYRNLFEKILTCWNKKDISYKHEASALLNRIFSELYKDNNQSDISNSKISESVKYIEYNYFKKDFTLEKAAEKSFFSNTYFRKLFKSEYGISPKKYVIQKRIKYAVSLIVSGYYSLEDVSALCGYNDYKHFSVEFKKITGVSPSKYTCIYAK